VERSEISHCAHAHARYRGNGGDYDLVAPARHCPSRSISESTGLCSNRLAAFRSSLRGTQRWSVFYAKCRRVTDGARTRDLRSHNPYEQLCLRPTISRSVAYLSRKSGIRGAGYPCVSGCVLASIAAALLPFGVFRQYGARELSRAF
jgi:hypothetical protein